MDRLHRHEIVQHRTDKVIFPRCTFALNQDIDRPLPKSRRRDNVKSQGVPFFADETCLFDTYQKLRKEKWRSKKVQGPWGRFAERVTLLVVFPIIEHFFSPFGKTRLTHRRN